MLLLNKTTFASIKIKIKNIITSKKCEDNLWLFSGLLLSNIPMIKESKTYIAKKHNKNTIFDFV
jgi:hypothetical protein